jgi:hypothetical protein
MKVKTIQSSFRKTRLIPLDPSIVLKKLKIYQGKQEVQALKDSDSEGSRSDRSEVFTTPPPRTLLPTFVDWPTPLTMHTRMKGSEYVKGHMQAVIGNEQPLTPSVAHVQNKLEKSAQQLMLSGALSKNQLYDLSLAAERRKNIEDGGKIVQKYGEIYGQAALRQIEEDRAEELLMVNMRDQHALKQLRKNWKAVIAEVHKKVPYYGAT